jgi:hypothetical protein
VFLPTLHAVIEGLKYAPAWSGALIAVNFQAAHLSLPAVMSAYYSGFQIGIGRSRVQALCLALGLPSPSGTHSPVPAVPQATRPSR